VLRSSSPFKGEIRRGMGSIVAALSCDPIPTPTLPLKGRELGDVGFTLKGREKVLQRLPLCLKKNLMRTNAFF
ncbi:MAG: hypothetical protein U1D97_05040, partial [Desulfuromonadales bacterium]|nr:hypothetical protein [Desulfuromonadales bacterium]